MNVLVVHSKLNNRPSRSGNRNGRRHHLVELSQATTVLVVPNRFGWRCWLGVGKAPWREPSTSGSYRFHPRPSAYRDRSRLGHQLGVPSSCRSSSASSAARVTQVARTPRGSLTGIAQTAIPADVERGDARQRPADRVDDEIADLPRGRRDFASSSRCKSNPSDLLRDLGDVVSS